MKKEIKVGDTIRIHRPVGEDVGAPGWVPSMDELDGKLCKVEIVDPDGDITVEGSPYLFSPDWCTVGGKTIGKVVAELNAKKILQKGMEFIEDLDEDIYDEYFSGPPEEEELDIEKHRWYETSLSVWRVGSGFIGVRSVTGLYSEQSSVSDICHTLRFYEMEPVPTITYRIKE